MELEDWQIHPLHRWIEDASTNTTDADSEGVDSNQDAVLRNTFVVYGSTLIVLFLLFA